jgi:hypothetical protein
MGSLLNTYHHGGDEGNRTPNPCLAKAVLCQLSYVPVGCPLVAVGGGGGTAVGADLGGCLVPEGFQFAALLQPGGN